MPARNVCRFVLSIVLIQFTAPLAFALGDSTSPNRWVENVHDPIPVGNLNPQQVRLAILTGMYETRGFSWQLERETANTITARFDYRGSSIIFDILYDDHSIQLLYVDGNNLHECQNLRDGICFKNAREYYNYSKNLRGSIAREIKRARKPK